MATTRSSASGREREDGLAARIQALGVGRCWAGSGPPLLCRKRAPPCRSPALSAPRWLPIAWGGSAGVRGFVHAPSFALEGWRGGSVFAGVALP